VVVVWRIVYGPIRFFASVAIFFIAAALIRLTFFNPAKLHQADG
jgi:hypothetical protein